MSAARAGLLLLPALIAVAVYVDGQRYDPATLKFDATGHAGAGALLPMEAAGLRMEGAPRIYGKDNLFEYVNGHAEFFISLGFKSLTVAAYSLPASPPGKPEYTVDLYDMDVSENAFGALAQESAGMDPADLGAMGFSSGRAAMFIAGKYYCKLDSFGAGGKLAELARAMASALPEDETGLPQFAEFPKSGAVKNGRSFKREDYMGLDFIQGVFEQEYDRAGERFFAFKFKLGDAREAFAQKTGDALKEMGAEVAQAAFAGAMGLLVRDKYEGPWALAFVNGQALGARQIGDEKALAAFMEEFVKKASGS